MKTLLKLLVILIVLVVLAGAVLWRIPAEFAYAQARDRLAPLVLEGLHGTVWEGHADAASVLGQRLGELDWTLAKRPLLQERLVARVRLHGGELDASGVVERAPGEFVVRGLDWRAPVSLFLPADRHARQDWRGTLGGTIVEARFQGAKLEAARGTLRWEHPGIAALPELTLPDLVADFAAQPDGSLAGSVRDDGSGRIAVDGQFKLRIGLLDADIVLRARAGHPLAARALERIGQAQDDGSRRLVLHETWP